jgi:hypothetical protein
MSDIALTSTSLPQTFLAKWAAETPRPATAIGKGDGTATGQDSEQALRSRLGEFAGNVFYGTLIRQMQDSKLKGQYFHGGRGEEVFQAQLGMELARRLGRAPNDPVVNRLYEAMSRAKKPETGPANQSVSGIAGSRLQTAEAAR